MIANGPLKSIVATKELMNRERRPRLHAANEAELKVFAALQEQPSFAEAMKAMKERRVPNFLQFEQEA